MLHSLQQALARMSERERRLVIIGGIAALGLLLIAVLLPLQRRASAAQARIERKREDLAWLRSMAPQLGGLAASAPPELRESLVVVIDRSARQSGLEKGLVGSQPSGDGGLNVRFEQTPFDGLIAWLSQLRERYGVQADSATVDLGSMPGTVNATLILRAR